MIPPFLRLLGAVAGCGSAILFWFMGSTLAAPIRDRRVFSLGAYTYQLLAFLFVPALILAVVALFWVPPRKAGQGPTDEGTKLRALLTAVFVAAFVIGMAR